MIREFALATLCGIWALLVLQREGLIKLRDVSRILATSADIVENPEDAKIKDLDAGVAGRSIDDLSAAVVNTEPLEK